MKVTNNQPEDCTRSWMAQLSSNSQEVNSRTETKVMKECHRRTATKYTDLLGQRREVFFSMRKKDTKKQLHHPPKV